MDPINVMVIRVQRHTNVRKQTALLEGVDVGPPKWRVCGSGLIQSIHEGVTDISNVNIHIKTRNWKCT